MYLEDKHNAIQSLQDLQSFRFVQDVRNSIALLGDRMIIGRPIGRVAIVGFGAEERPNGVELENNLLEPKLIRYNNRNATIQLE